MYSKEALESKTVVELRQIAKENGVKLSAGISKQGIVDRLCESLTPAEAPAPAAPEAPAPAAPRRTVSIVADDEDTPVLTPNVPFVRSQTPAARPAAPAPAPAPAVSASQPAARSGNIPGTNKPAFTLEGARAWHNPRTYQQPNSSPYPQQRPAAGYGAQQRPAANAYGVQRTTPRPPTVSRFGPDAAQSENDAAEPQQEPRPRYSAPYGQDTRPACSNNGYQNDYRSRRDASSGMALPELLASGDVIDDGGVLEMQSEGHGYLRTGNYLPGSSDIYVSPAQVRRFHLRTGDKVWGKVRPRREGETHGMLLYVTEVNGIDAQDVKEPAAFDTLTAIYPTSQIQLSKKAPGQRTLRVIDLMCPIGFGQRALILAPPRCGKTALLTAMANSIHAQYPEAELLSLLLGERPEDITVARDTLPGEVIYAGFDEPMENHTRIAELTMERAMRLAEQKKDVVLLVDNLTALCRACSECAPQNVRILPGGLAAGSLAKPKRLFGSARALREGGSLTIIAVMLEDTGIALDQAIAEEFRGTANMELYLNQQGQIDYLRSMTRNAASMLDEKAAAAAAKLHQLAAEQGSEAFGAYLDSLLSENETNKALLEKLG